jgi:uncharacterized membrane protein
MVNKRTLKASMASGVFLFGAMHYYYPHDPAVLTGKASMNVAPSAFTMSSVMSFSFAMLVEYLIIVFAIYVFFRSVIKSFEGKMTRRI